MNGLYRRVIIGCLSLISFSLASCNFFDLALLSEEDLTQSQIEQEDVQSDLSDVLNDDGTSEDGASSEDAIADDNEETQGDATGGTDDQSGAEDPNDTVNDDDTVTIDGDSESSPGLGESDDLDGAPEGGLSGGGGDPGGAIIIPGI